MAVEIPKTMFCDECYCDQPVEISPDGSLIECAVCNYGIAPLDAVREAGSVEEWLLLL